MTELFDAMLLRKRYGPVPGVWVFVREVQAAAVHEQAELLEVA